jgi:uncharacterized membrane protein
MPVIVVVGTAAVWAFALLSWPGLPEQIPTHFDLSGNANAWEEPSLTSWFLLPILATLGALLLGFLLPRLIVGMARRNSCLLNMPHRERFRALPEAARLRAVGSMTRGLQMMSVSVTLLFGWILYGMREVACNHWQTLPPIGTFSFTGLLIGHAVWLVIAASRAVTREERLAD